MYYLVSHRGFRWNSLHESLAQLYSKLIDLGIEYHDGRVYLADIENLLNHHSE
jgi:hypothetical protein